MKRTQPPRIWGLMAGWLIVSALVGLSFSQTVAAWIVLTNVVSMMLAHSNALHFPDGDGRERRSRKPTRGFRP
jgi:hypothetical protein